MGAWGLRPSPREVNGQRNERDEQEKVNQATGDMEDNCRPRTQATNRAININRNDDTNREICLSSPSGQLARFLGFTFAGGA